MRKIEKMFLSFMQVIVEWLYLIAFSLILVVFYPIIKTLAGSAEESED